ncbi:hypothetical protein M5D96_006342, partial [Drosophila gunungcola]
EKSKVEAEEEEDEEEAEKAAKKPTAKNFCRTFRQRLKVSHIFWHKKS